MGVATSLTATATVVLLSSAGPSPPVTLIVNGTSPTSMLYGANVTFFADQQQLAVVPAQFSSNSPPDAQFTANLTTSFLAPGAVDIQSSTIYFFGPQSGGFGLPIVNNLTILVQANTIVTVDPLTPNPATIQENVVITASLAALYAGAQNALAGQTIAFYSGGSPLETGTTDSNGLASIGTSFSQAQQYSITAQFSGSSDGVYLASTSAPVSLQINPLPVSSTPAATSSAPAATSSTPATTSSAPATTLAATTGFLASTPPSTTLTPPSTTFTPPSTTRTPVATTAAPLTTTTLSTTTVSPTTPTTVPVLKVTAHPSAAEFPGCGKRTNLTATVSDVAITGSITFDLTSPRLVVLPNGQNTPRQLGIASLSGGTATLATSLFPAFPPGDYSIRATYTGPSTLDGGSARVTYPVSTLCL